MSLYHKICLYFCRAKYEKNEPLKIKETKKVKIKICSRCLMQVGNNHWAEHWRRNHKITAKSGRIELREHHWAEEPFFVSQPWRDNLYKQEDEVY